MELIFFETVVVAVTVRDEILVALFDGSIEHATNSRCVALLSCRRETAEALTQSLGSVLKAESR